jgi:2-C-methyl-D-erythritol 4-phosphate cytidylyltransferase
LSVGVIIPAAGRGKRMGTKVSKQFLPLGDKPVLIHTLMVFETHPEVDEIVVVAGAGEVSRVEEMVAQYGLEKISAVATGGQERQDSVRSGLEHLQTEWVLVHDAARPFVTHGHITELLKVVRLHGAAILAVPVKDTIKQVDPAGIVERTPDRQSLWAVQTPQAFRRSLLVQAHQRALEQGMTGTDDAMLVEELGIDVRVVMGDYQNIKLTTPEDLAIAEAIWKMRGTER